ELKKDFGKFNLDAYSELQKTTNVFVKLRSNWTYFQADFKYENVIASELRMEFPIKLKELGQIITNIGQFIYQKCGKHLWNLVDKMDELTNCSNRLDFAEFGRSFRTNRSFKLEKLVVNVLKCEEAANGADKWSCPYNDHIFEHITDCECKRFVLKGLLQFGRLFMETFGIIAIEMKPFGPWLIMHWKQISIRVTLVELKMLKEILDDAGLIETMGDEIWKNRVGL
uniref:DHC_N1 domain-containing protein n=1 Tax=Globodera pallida TaxID=36090 RepID=A0A183CR41_GLOPA